MILNFDPEGLDSNGGHSYHGRKAISHWLQHGLGARVHDGWYYRLEIDTDDVQAFMDARISPEVRRHLRSTRLHLFEYELRGRMYCAAHFNDMLSRPEWDARQAALRYERRLGLGLMAHHDARLSHNHDVAATIARYLK
jgi:hypothetical protein